MSLDMAAKAAAEAGFTVGTGGYLVTDTPAWHTVVAQDPKEYTRTKEGTNISLTIGMPGV